MISFRAVRKMESDSVVKDIWVCLEWKKKVEWKISVLLYIYVCNFWSCQEARCSWNWLSGMQLVIAGLLLCQLERHCSAMKCSQRWHSVNPALHLVPLRRPGGFFFFFSSMPVAPLCFGKHGAMIIGRLAERKSSCIVLVRLLVY